MQTVIKKSFPDCLLEKCDTIFKDLIWVKPGSKSVPLQFYFEIAWANQCQKVAENSKYGLRGTLLKPAFTLL